MAPRKPRQSAQSDDRRLAALITRGNKKVSEIGGKVGAVCVPPDLWDMLEPDLASALATYAPSMGKYTPWAYVGLTLLNLGAVGVAVARLRRQQLAQAASTQPAAESPADGQPARQDARPEDMDAFMRAQRGAQQS